jgi:formylglycine-generating enzyme required for sulfatase activity
MLGFGVQVHRRPYLTALAAWLMTACAPGDEIAAVDSTAQLVPGATFRDCSDCPKMVMIASGSFMMGSADGEDEREQATDWDRAYHSPRHPVTIARAFALGEYDVTRAEFSVFARETGHQASDTCYGHAAAVGLPVTWRDPGYPQTERDPVVCVSWKDAQAYLAWLSRKTGQRYRLPSEAEWEYAARAGTSTARYWGDGIAEACRYANVADLVYAEAQGYRIKHGEDFECADGHIYTSPVGSFLPNPFGLYDMLGNVRQLTADCWNYSYEGAPSDASAWLYDMIFSRDCITVRVTRGSNFESLPSGVRAARRGNQPDFLPSDAIGFRVARDISH